MANLRAGLIGLGMMGRHHARNLRSIDGVDLVAVADAAGDPHGLAGDLAVLPNVDALLEQGLDYVVVAAPTMYHEEIGLKLAEASVHALIEKPLAKTVDGARARHGCRETRSSRRRDGRHTAGDDLDRAFTRQRFQVFFGSIRRTEAQTLRDFRTRGWHTRLADMIPDEIKHLLLPGR